MNPSTATNILTHSSSVWTMVSSLLVLSGAGLLTFALRRIPHRIFRFILARFTVSVTFHTGDVSSHMLTESFFIWFMKQTSSRHLRRFLFDSSARERERATSQHSVQRGIGAFTPGTGLHFFTFHGRPAWFSREKAGNTAMSTTTHEVEVYFFGTKRKLIEDFLEEIKPKTNPKNISIYALGRKYGEPSWGITRAKPKRDLKSVIVRHDVKDKIVAEIKEFFERESWYAERGITHKLSYIFHGQPGTGKSSFIFALASHFHRSVYTVNMNTLDDSSFQTALDAVPANGFIVIEDIDVSTATAEREDVVFNKDGKIEEAKKQKISMSTILNTLDGIASLSGNVIFLSTNHVDKLDRALTRRGRVDHIVEIPPMRDEEIREYVALMYPSAVVPDHIRFPNMPGADVQGNFLDHKEDFNGFLLEMTKSNQTKEE
jgi:chaperone BCS1